MGERTQRGIAEEPSVRPSETLEPEALYSLYLGGLSFPDRTQRLRAATVILLCGRLGLRPGEIQHLHEEWIDWGRGALVIPARDPCACQQCWETARHAQRTGDGRQLLEILTETTWSPPGDGRTIPFGWSQRLTAILEMVCEQEGYIDLSAEAMTRLVDRSARRADGLNHEGVDIRTLRATAISFFADVGFRGDRIADLVGERPETVRPFVQHEGGDVRDQLSELFDAATDPGDVYVLVGDPEPFDPEPFDPREFDSGWRQTKMRQRANDPDRLHNPRPVADGIDSAIEASDLGTREYLDADSGLVDETTGTSRLRQWVARREPERRGDRPIAGQDRQPSATDTTDTATDGQTRSASTGRMHTSPETNDSPARPSKSSSEPPTGSHTDESEKTSQPAAALGAPEVFNPRDHLSGPPVLTVETTVACSEFAEGRPTDTRVFLGPEELLFVRNDDSMAPDYARIELSTVVDQSLDYLPDRLKDTFESAVTVAYNVGNGRQLAVIGLSGNQRISFANGVFKTILSEVSIVITHPARKGGRVMRTDPVEGVLSVDDRSVSVAVDDAETEAFTIQLSDLIYFELEKQTYNDQRFRSLSVRHLNSASEALKTTIAIRNDRKHKLFQRFVRRSYRERKRKIEGLRLTEEHKEVLVALYSAGEGFDISMIIDKPTDELQELLRSLGQVGLVRMSDSGTVLTGLGYVVVNEKIEDVNV